MTLDSQIVSGIVQALGSLLGTAIGAIIGGKLLLRAQHETWLREREGINLDRQTETVMRIQEYLVELIDKATRYIASDQRKQETPLLEDIYHLTNKLWMLRERMKDESLSRDIADLSKLAPNQV
jgi:hypothetical protein